MSSTRCMTKSLRDEVLVLRVDSVRLIRAGTLPKLWRQARIVSDLSLVEFPAAERWRSLRWVRVAAAAARAGL